MLYFYDQTMFKEWIRMCPNDLLNKVMCPNDLLNTISQNVGKEN